MQNSNILRRLVGSESKRPVAYFSDKDTERHSDSFPDEDMERNGHLLHTGRHYLLQPHWDFFPFHGAGAQNGGHMPNDDIRAAERAMDL